MYSGMGLSIREPITSGGPPTFPSTILMSPSVDILRDFSAVLAGRTITALAITQDPYNQNGGPRTIATGTFTGDSISILYNNDGGGEVTMTLTLSDASTETIILCVLADPAFVPVGVI